MRKTIASWYHRSSFNLMLGVCSSVPGPEITLHMITPVYTQWAWSVQLLTMPFTLIILSAKLATLFLQCLSLLLKFSRVGSRFFFPDSYFRVFLIIPQCSWEENPVSYPWILTCSVKADMVSINARCKDMCFYVSSLFVSRL